MQKKNNLRNNKDITKCFQWNNEFCTNQEFLGFREFSRGIVVKDWAIQLEGGMSFE